jgi:D-alanyl-lipoteichoic acid acyltransferase DltB (MBOAT superfamily)
MSEQSIIKVLMLIVLFIFRLMVEDITIHKNKRKIRKYKILYFCFKILHYLLDIYTKKQQQQIVIITEMLKKKKERK